MANQITLFGELLRELREQSGLSQEAIAALSGEMASMVAQYYGFKELGGLSREQINRMEGLVLKHKPQDRTLMLLSHTMAEALRRAGYETADPVKIYDDLRTAMRPAIPLEAVSDYALKLDMAMRLYFNEPERSARWEGIITGIKTEQEELRKLRRKENDQIDFDNLE